MSAPESREKAVFYAALEVADPAQRRLFLDQTCAGDAALRAAVEELLVAQGDAEQFFAEGASSLTPSAHEAERASASAQKRGEPAFEEKPGTILGRYKLLEKIGEGGYGVVYMAEQEQPVRRRVALKVIKLGMDTKSVIARFEAERQALALMNHPNIARVLDAGATETGRPYFVMELVHGVKITEYCDQNRLGLEQRLELFIQICHAIQHAHQKGIIHRDIKPSNILVTMHDGVPVPKVIDFGVAKATGQRLTDKTLFTSYAQLIGTPAYMSPEQMELSGLDLDTRSDIYSLGVLLYELLTGRTPFDTKELLKSGVDEMRRTLREREPHSPSAKLHTFGGAELTKTALQRCVEPPRLLSQLRGDLDWIVMKALEKDRTRRYETANGLAMDIQRYLNNEPVLARPPSNWYRLQKLVRRNQIVFAAGAAVAATLLIATAASTWLFLRERDARSIEAQLLREAERREKATQVALLVTQQKYEDADKHLGDIGMAKSSIEAAAELRALGDWHALNGRWRNAAERFASVARVDQLDDPEVVTVDQLKLGSALIESGDLSGYEQFRQRAIARFNSASYPAADWLIKIGLLLPADQMIIGSLQSQAELVKNTFLPPNDATPDPVRAALRAEALALLEYRRGNYATAAGWCEHCLAYPLYYPSLSATAHVIRAMSSWQMDNKGTALSDWSLGQVLIEAKFKQGIDRGNGLEGFWFDWIIGRLLLRECNEQFAKADHSLVLATMPQPNLADAAMIRALAEWHALRHEWREAGERYRSLLKVDHLDYWEPATLDCLDCGAILVELGDTAGYEGLREEAISRFKGTDDRAIAERIIKISLLRPADEKIMTALTPLAEVAARPFTNANGNSKEAGPDNAWCFMSLGLLEYRRGNYAKAADWSRRCVASTNNIPLPSPTARVILAMSLHQLGQDQAARSELEQAGSTIENGFESDWSHFHWRDWLFGRILLGEATVLLEGAPGLTVPTAR